MKTLEEYNLIKEFISAQGIQPTVAMLCANEKEWSDLVYLSKAWERELAEDVVAEKAKLEGLSDEELGQLDREHQKAEQREREELLFYSSGSDPEG